MIKDMFRHWHGYLKIEIKGNALSRFINQMTDIGIVIWNLKEIDSDYYLANIYKDDFLKLRDLLRKRKCTVKIIQKKGVPFYFWKLKKRVFLVIAIFIFFVIFYFASSLLLFFQIDGLVNLDEKEIYNLLREQGIKRFVSKDDIDTGMVENLLFKSFPQIAWVDVRWHGTKLNIDIVEKKMVEESKNVEVLATRDGVITELIVLRGVAVVNEGDTVREGQILIVPAAEEEEARGIVKANVWYETTASIRLYNQEIIKTGNKKSFYGLSIASYTFFFPRITNRYQNYIRSRQVKKLLRWRNIVLPIELIKEEHKEIDLLIENRSHQLANHLAREKTLSYIINNIDSEAKIISIDFEETINEDKKYLEARTIVMVEENIAIMGKEGGF
ncbi:sporulation protein YqfD [Natronospora cellulosivora (SeqCode)]